MKPEFKSSNSEFWLIFKNLNYGAENIGNDLSAKKADKKMPIKNADKDETAIRDVKERRARQLLRTLQEQNKVESYGANKKGLRPPPITPPKISY